MQSKKKIIRLFCVTAIIIIGGLVWWNVPTSIVNISSSEVSGIVIFDGNTGKETSITDTNEIEHIIGNLNAISIKKEKVSLGYMGYSFRTTIYNTDSAVYKEFIINSNNTIRKDPFFYRDSSGSIDYDYIQELLANKNK